MSSFLCIFCPSFFGLALMYNMNKGCNTFNALVIKYFVTMLLTNVIMEILLIKVFGITSYVNDLFTSYPGFACKYILSAIIISIIVAFVLQIIIKNFSFKVVVVNHGKKKK